MRVIPCSSSPTKVKELSKMKKVKNLLEFTQEAIRGLWTQFATFVTLLLMLSSNLRPKMEERLSLPCILTAVLHIRLAVVLRIW